MYMQMPPNLVALFAHVMSRANEGSRGSAAHSWDEAVSYTHLTLPTIYSV